MKSAWTTAAAVALITATAGVPFAAEVTLVAEGTPQAAVVLAAAPDSIEIRAAAELVEHIHLISGAELPVVRAQAPAGMLPIRLGRAAGVHAERLVRERSDNPSAFALIVDTDEVHIRGVSAEGTRIGVYELLEQLGVRFYLPGDLGRVVPEGDTIHLPTQTTVQVPSMDYRRLQHISVCEWRHRVRLGGTSRSTGAHGIPPFRGNQDMFEQHPECFARIDGERRFRQICASNPDAVALTVAWIREHHAPTNEKIYLGMGPNDGGGYCECEGCADLDGGVFDPVYGTTSVTGRYIWFFNEVLDHLEDDYPNLHLVWYVYARHMMPPPPELKPNPRIVGVFAPITLDRIRGMDNPMSPDRYILRWVIDAWSELDPNELYYRGYYNNLACPQFPISQVDRIRHETPVFREKGINVMRVEVIQQSWASNAISLYLATRLMWDVDTDVDALLAEFYRKFYGPAAGPMGAYHEALDAAFRDTPYFAGTSYPYFAIFEAERRATLRRHLDAAITLAGEYRGRAPYAERVRIARLGFDRLELFLDLIEARNRFDFALAHRTMQEYLRLNDEMVDYVLEGEGERAHRLVHWRERSESRGSYFNRFFAMPVRSGYHRLVEAGELVAGLPDEWDFLLDPTGLGQISGWHRPGPLGGNWQPLKTFSRTWSDQGLHYYKGTAWYRTQVSIPEEFRGRRVYLWFGGVDEVASIWVNGQFLGTSQEPGEGLPGVPGSFRPFDVDATQALRFGGGETNTVTVRVVNERLSELGTGGITAPVMFWSPHDPAWTAP